MFSTVQLLAHKHFHLTHFPLMLGQVMEQVKVLARVKVEVMAYLHSVLLSSAEVEALGN